MSFRRLIEKLLLPYLAIIFWAGLWPLDFDPANSVTLLKEEKALYFHWPPPFLFSKAVGGSAFTPKAFVQPKSAANEQSGLSIELWLMSSDDNDRCFSPILTLYDQRNEAVLYVDQYKADLFIQTAVPDSNEFDEVALLNILRYDEKNFVTIVLGNQRASFYLNGKLVKMVAEPQRLSGPFRLDKLRLYLANTMDFDCPWRGWLYGTAIYPHPLGPIEVAQHYDAWQHRGAVGNRSPGALASYLFDALQDGSIVDGTGLGNYLNVPPRMVFEKKFLSPVSTSNLSVSDILLNIFGLIPLGFFCFWIAADRYGLRWSIALSKSMLCGLIFSLMIEITQGFMPLRDSDQMDVICNTLGSAIGAFIASCIWQRFSLSGPEMGDRSSGDGMAAGRPKINSNIPDDN